MISICGKIKKDYDNDFLDYLKEEMIYPKKMQKNLKQSKL